MVRARCCEFVCGGEVRAMPDPDTCSDAEWTAYLFNRNSVPGVKREWWCHTPSGYWFIAERDTARDEFLKTYLMRAQLAGARHDVPPAARRRRVDRPLAHRSTSSSKAGSFTGFAGDTITSALAAAGEMTLARSFKYHRPRGILSVREPRRQQPVPGRWRSERARRRRAARGRHARRAR